MTAAMQRAVMIGLAALVVVSLAYPLAQTTWRLAGDPGTGIARVAPLAGSADVASADGADISPILAMAPFGSAAPLPEAAPQETSLGLVLLGVVVADLPSASSAIISAAGGPASAYGVGDDVIGGAVLEAVNPDSVTLRVAGRREILSFPNPQSATSPPYTLPPSGTPGAVGGGAVPQTPNLSTGLDSGTSRVDGNAIADDFRRRIAANPQTVMTEVGLDATAEGYRLKESMMPELRRAGLRPGDLVVRINGKPVGDVEQDRTLFDDVVASGRARVEVMREGRLIVMAFPLR